MDTIQVTEKKQTTAWVCGQRWAMSQHKVQLHWTGDSDSV